MNLKKKYSCTLIRLFLGQIHQGMDQGRIKLRHGLGHNFLRLESSATTRMRCSWEWLLEVVLLFLF